MFSNLNPRPMTSQKPRPPSRTKPNNTSNSTAVGRTSTLNLPQDPIAPQTLRHKLSSSSMSSSVPPDSPPTTFDSPTIPFPRTSVDQDLDLDSPSTGKGKWQSSLGRTSTSSLSIPFPTGSASPLRQRQASARAISMTSRKSKTNLQRGTSVGDMDSSSHQEGPEMSSDLLREKSREELEALLLSADKVIREEKQKLALIAQHGTLLLEEHENLRRRHESLLTRSPYRPSISRSSELRERPPPSPATQRRTGASPQNQLSPTTDDGWDEDKPSLSPASSFTPIRNSNFRTRVTSTASVTSLSSLFAPSPRQVSSPGPQEVQRLMDVNYELSVQVSELEAGSERIEREGKKKLRKLEKDLFELKQELSRAQSRNNLLESTTADSTTSVVSKPWTTWTTWTTLPREDSMNSIMNYGTPLKRPEIPTRKGSLPETPTAASFAPSSPASPTTPTSNTLNQTFRRSPGVGTPANPPRQLSVSPPTDATASEKTPAETQDDLITQLMAKIDELQEANETISEERVEMAERLDLAQSRIDDLKRQCEDLEELAETALAWEDRKGAIGWHSEGSDDSPVRFRGNQGMMDRSQLSQSTSDRSISSIDSIGIRHNYNGTSMYDRPRTLGSELGSEWPEENGNADEGDDDEERSEATASTSTPVKYRGHKSRTSTYQSTADLDEIVPPGSLRDGPPDAEGYEEIIRAVATLPPLWEDEYNFGQVPPGPSKTILGALDWTVGETSEFWDDKYPEDGIGLIEDKDRRTEAEDARRARAITRKLRKRTSRNIPNSDGSLRTRRDMALERMGLDNPITDSDDFDYSYSDSEMSDFDVVQRTDYNRRGSDYYPLTLRARYHPKMVVARAMDSARQHANWIATYIRFFLLLAFAVAYALWQGPKKTLNSPTNARRRRIQQ